MNDVITRDGPLLLLTEADVGKYIRVQDPGNVRIQVNTFNPEIGATITLEHVSLGRVDIEVIEGATIRVLEMFYPEILGMYGVVTLKCVASNEWVLFGALRPKPDWQLDVDRGTGLNYELDFALDTDWATELEQLNAQLDAFKSGLI